MATPPKHPRPSFLPNILPPILLSATGALACYIASGATLGVFLGGLLIVTILLPPLFLADDHWPARLSAFSATLTPIGIIWLIAALRSDTRFLEFVAAFAILSAYALALAGLSLSLRMFRLSAVAAAAMTVILALAWLT